MTKKKSLNSYENTGLSFTVIGKGEHLEEDR